MLELDTSLSKLSWQKNKKDNLDDIIATYTSDMLDDTIEARPNGRRVNTLPKVLKGYIKEGFFISINYTQKSDPELSSMASQQYYSDLGSAPYYYEKADTIDALTLKQSFSPDRYLVAITLYKTYFIDPPEWAGFYRALVP